MAERKRRQIWAIAGGVTTIAALFGVITANAAQPTHAVQATAQPEPAAVRSLLDAARAKLGAAERMCQMFHDRDSGAPRGGPGAEANYLWSMRRMDAELEVSRLDPNRQEGAEAAAVTRHLEWMRAWNKTVVESGAFSLYEIASTEYYIAEAEAALTKARRP